METIKLYNITCLLAVHSVQFNIVIIMGKILQNGIHSVG
jgi:hypothetical protein